MNARKFTDKHILIYGTASNSQAFLLAQHKLQSDLQADPASGLLSCDFLHLSQLPSPAGEAHLLVISLSS